MSHLSPLVRSLAWTWVAAGLVALCTWSFWRDPVEQSFAHVREWQRERETLRKAQELEEAIEARLERQVARLRAKEHICRDLIASRVSLSQAARQVSELPDAPDSFWATLRSMETGTTDEERVCRHLIDWACGLVMHEPDQAEALRQRLEAELQARLNE
jgi:hypothetical protein